MATKIEIQKKLDKLGVEYSDDENFKQLEKKLKEATSNDSVKMQTALIVWLKSRAYIDDKKRIDAGVYLMDELPIRLSKLPYEAIEVFENEVPSKKLAQIARWAGLNPDGVDGEKILSKVVTDIKPF